MSTANDWKPCGCKARIEQMLLKHYATQLAPSEAISCELKGFGIAVTDTGLESAPFMPFEVTYRHTAKRTGAVSVKAKKANFYFNFCPACGQPANARAAQQIAANAAKTAAELEHAA
jgi:hypothetical protein